MMTEHMFAIWIARLGFSEEATAFIQEIRRSDPSRLVQCRVGNVTVRYPSLKMARTIQGESVRGEWAALLDLEYDPDVLEYYDQPRLLWLRYPTKTGALGRPVKHVPDLFVLRASGAGFEECKPDAVLRRLAESCPSRYVQGADGAWRSPPAERLVAPYGFYFRIRCAEEINWVANRNMVFLEDYLRSPEQCVAAEVEQTIRDIVSSHPAIPLVDLLRQVVTLGIATDAVYRLIAFNRLYVDLRAYPLAEPERAPVFPSAGLAQAYAVTSAAPPKLQERLPGVEKVTGARVRWDGQTYILLNVGHTRLTLRSEHDQFVELPHETFDALVAGGSMVGLRSAADPPVPPNAWGKLLRVGPADQAEAARRYQVITPYLAGHRPAAETTPARTVRLWLRAWRLAEEAHGCGLIGLLPRTRDRGGHTAKLPEGTLQAMDACISEHYETLKQRSIRSVYGLFLQACDRRTQQDPNFIIPSYQTFCHRVKMHSGPRQIRLRAGARAAYQAEPFYWELAMTTPRHGDRPWEVVHLDHTELDVELVYEESGRGAGRCWLSIVTDAATRRFLAVYISYDPPSYRSCMMLMRILVQRWGRLPQTIVVDNGPEFRSGYFEVLLARYEITKKARPASHPRHGSVCERLFGTTTTQMIHNLRGNTQITKVGRRMTTSVDPKRQACWTLGDLYVSLCTYAYEVYDTLEHPALGCSPRDAYVKALTLGGERTHRRIPYDDEFRMLTFPSTPKGTAAIDAQRGIKIAGVYYWHEVMRDPLLARQQVPVRYDPFDIGIAYVYLRDRWVKCYSEHHALLSGHSEREVQLATHRLRAHARSHGQSFRASARHLAQFLTGVDAKEEVLNQGLRDRAARRVVAVIEAGDLPQTDRLPAGGRQEVLGEAAPTMTAVAGGSVETAAEQAARERRRLKGYGSFL